MRSVKHAENHPFTSESLSAACLLGVRGSVCQTCVAESQCCFYVKSATSIKPSTYGGGLLTKLIRD